MHAQDVLKYGNLTVLRTLQGLPQADWETPGVCGVWSVKEIVAHLASFEHILVEALTMALGRELGPYWQAWMADGQAFNDAQVPARSALTPAQTLKEYKDTHALTMELAAELPADRFKVTGLLPDYGLEYDLDDFITYAFYGHKREHMSQVNVFRDQIKR